MKESAYIYSRVEMRAQQDHFINRVSRRLGPETRLPAKVCRFKFLFFSPVLTKLLKKGRTDSLLLARFWKEK